jgi:phospholipase C
MLLSRRRFNRVALLASGAALAGPILGPKRNLTLAAELPALPNPDSSGIQHIVAVTMENRSFDHFLGWLPNADGKQAGLSYVDKSGVTHQTHSLSGNFTGCPAADPDHSYSGARVEYDNGKMDGFLRAGQNDTYSIGYYGASDIPFYAALARNYTACDRYFAAILGPTFPNRNFIHAAQTDRLTNSIQPSSLPTIWDRLSAARISANYYFSNVPYLALWGTKYLNISRTYDDFLQQAKSGTLPAVSFLDPRYTILDDGTGNDDHPHSDIREGDRFLYDVFEAVAKGPDWASTVLVINFDEWGGFFDHVAPPRATAANNVDTDIVGGKTLLGLRLPAVIASPWSLRDPSNPQPSSLVFDHTSVLKLIEWRWSLPPLTPRDASSDINNLAYALDFQKFSPQVPTLPKPSTPFIALPCFQNLLGGLFSRGDITGASPLTTSKTTAINTLKQQAVQHGFNVK